MRAFIRGSGVRDEAPRSRVHGHAARSRSTRAGLRHCSVDIAPLWERHVCHGLPEAAGTARRDAATDGSPRCSIEGVFVPCSVGSSSPIICNHSEYPALTSRWQPWKCFTATRPWCRACGVCGGPASTACSVRRALHGPRCSCHTVQCVEDGAKAASTLFRKSWIRFCVRVGDLKQPCVRVTPSLSTG